MDLVLPAPGVVVPAGVKPEELPTVAVALLTRGAQLLEAYLRSDGCLRRLEVAQRLSVPPGYSRSGVWMIPDSLIWPGLRPDAGPEAQNRWETNRENALKCGIILPPDSQTPVVVPDGMQQADCRQWERMCCGWA
ncbi:MAG: hypothetical protein WCY01_00260 [Alkalispirochaeta sp.]